MLIIKHLKELSEQPNYDIIVAIIALVSTAITATLSAISTRKNEVKLRHLENELATKRAEQDARRDYEYEARKRLYQECEPILFQFAESSESAVRRIYALARNAREGNLGPDRFWLSTDHYFMRSTIYRLLAPMAVFKLLQRRLTGIDLKLDPTINVQYTLAKILYFTFSSSVDLARSEPAIPYDPDQIALESKNVTEIEKAQNRISQPQKFWLQGLKVGIIDTLAESLILIKNGTDPRIKSFGEFEQEFFKEDEHPENRTGGNRFEVFFTLFSHFHPETRPVLWRVLISQAYLYNAIINIRSNNTSTDKLHVKSFDKFKMLFDIEYTKSECNWHQTHEAISNEKFTIPFRAAENYLKKQLSTVSSLK